jgi:mRNA interferase RelE/StbE
MAYRLVFTKQADRTLRKAPRSLSDLIRSKLNQVAADPYAHHGNVTKLQNRPGFRLRVGNWRVIYEIQDDQLVILVLKIATRGDVYQ